MGDMPKRVLAFDRETIAAGVFQTLRVIPHR
jgi:hypothetical protein